MHEFLEFAKQYLPSSNVLEKRMVTSIMMCTGSTSICTPHSPYVSLQHFLQRKINPLLNMFDNEDCILFFVIKKFIFLTETLYFLFLLREPSWMSLVMVMH